MENDVDVFAYKRTPGYAPGNSFINTSYSPTSTLFAFHTNKKQYLDTLHIQKKKEMRGRMHNNDFDMLLGSVH